jgi:cell surface protein SprA
MVRFYRVIRQVLDSYYDVHEAKNGWLTDYQEFNQNFTQVTNKMFKATANVDLFPDLKIDLTADRFYSEISEQYNVLEYGIIRLSFLWSFSISTF